MADTQEPGASLITKEEAAKVQQVSGQVAALREQAASLEVRNDGEAVAAAEFMVSLKVQMDELEEARTFIVKPMNDHVKAINARFKPNREALEAVEREMKGKVLSYQRVQEELRRAEQARLDAERKAEEERLAKAAREREVAAQREREAAEQAAREAAQAAAAAERERMEAIQREEGGRRDRISKLGEDALKRIAEGGGEDASLATEELAGREAHREAQAAAERAAVAAETARKAEEAAAAPVEVPVAQQAAAPVRLAGTSSKKRWTVEVVDPLALESWALTPDMTEIRRRVREGLRESPGLRIYQEDELAIRSR